MSDRNFVEFATQPVETVATALRSSVVTGLRSEVISAQRDNYGTNQFTQHVTTGWEIFGRQFKSPFIYMLFAAAGLALLLREWIDGGMVILFITINAGLGFYQEYHSEKTFQLLRQYIKVNTKVRRDGKEQFIDSTAVVVGDIVVLEAGDVVPADLRLHKTHDFMIDESALTGESAAVSKQHELLTKPIKEVYEAVNCAFSGTIVVSGAGEGIVIAVGTNTMIGAVAQAVSETTRVSEFETNISKFSGFILRLVLITLSIIFIANVLLKQGHVNLGELSIFCITLVVGVIPEALPVVTTFSLSRGALRLAKNKVVVKRLSAIEDLGSVEVLCTDKTGTLTENVMTVADIYGLDQTKALWFATLAGDVTVDTEQRAVNSFDVALNKRWTDNPVSTHTDSVERINEIPFDPVRRRNSVIVKIGTTPTLIVRGSPEAVMVGTTITTEQRIPAEQWMKDQGSQGRRLVAVAAKNDATVDYNVTDEDRGLEFIGVISFVDPIKESAKQAIEDARELGVSIKILTGDNKEVAGAVAHQVGLVKSPTDVILGEQLNGLSHSDQMDVVRTHTVFARLSPEQKCHIIQLLETQFDVGFLGDGINDAPALKSANVALVVQGATDIAREAADIILLQNSLHVIISGIREGRAVFANTIKYIKATLSSNYGNFYSVAIVSMFVDFLPMLPLQILLVNLLSDFPMIAIATDTVDDVDLRRPRSYDVKEIFLISTILGLTSTVFDFIFFGLFYKMGQGTLQTNWFIGSILTELLFMFSIRTRFFFLRAKSPSSTVLWLSCLAAVVTVAIPFTSFGQQVFQFVAPQPIHLLWIAGVLLTYVVLTESIKLLYYHFIHPLDSKSLK